MDAYKAWGVDLAIDLEHQMLDSEIAPDPTAKDARGWCQLELRSDGSLWAVNVKWTDDGRTRLLEKRQRYVSPAFNIDPDSSRITSMVNVAITAIPATHDTPALVAARRARDRRKLSTEISFDDIGMALRAALNELYPQPAGDSCSPDAPWIQDVYDASVVYQMEGDYFQAPYTFDGTKATLGTAVQVRRTYVPVDAPAVAAETAPEAAQPQTPAPAAPVSPPVTNKKSAVRRLATALGESKMTIEEFLKVIKALGLDPSMTLDAAMAKIQGTAAPADDASKEGKDAPADPAAPADGAAPAPDASAEDKKDKPVEMAAAVSKFMRLTGAKSFVDAVSIVETYRESHLELETERQKLAKERETLETAERRKGCIDLVTLGGRAPATVWADDKATSPKKYLAAMPIADFREYVADALKSKGVKASVTVTPPAGNSANLALTPEELAICVSMKCDPAAYAALKAQRDNATVARGGN